jgi:hypothetical protein
MNYTLLQNPILYFCLGIIITFSLIEIRNKCFIKNNSQKMLNNIISTLVRQASRWSTAAEQDESPLIAVLHANYGAGYLWALKDIASNDQIESATGINSFKFEKEITTIQDDTTTNLVKICPRFAPKSSYLTKLGGEGI